MAFELHKVKKTYNLLLYEHGSPRRLALAFSLGIFIGVSPFVGLHTLLAIIFSYLFRLNKPAALLGTLVFNPLLAPFLIFFSLEIGSWILLYRHITLPTLTEINTLLKEPNWQELFNEFFFPYFLGSLILGAILAFVAFWIAFWIARSSREPDSNSNN